MSKRFDMAIIIDKLQNDGFILDITLECKVEGDLILGDIGQVRQTEGGDGF